MAAPQNVGVGQRVRLHGLSTQQLNGAEGVVRDPLTDGRVGVAITSAAAEVLERWPCCRLKLENLTLLPSAPRFGPPEVQAAAGKFKSDCSQRACDSCLKEARSHEPLRECGACKQAFYCDAGETSAAKSASCCAFARRFSRVWSFVLLLLLKLMSHD